MLDPRAILPTVAHPGEDLAYDVYALETVKVNPGQPTKIRTGIAAAFDLSHVRKEGPKYGLLVRDRSSMAARGFYISGGVVDAGYRGEIIVIMNLDYTPGEGGKIINAGDKIAQLIPLPALTGKEVADFEEKTERGTKGFGSSDTVLTQTATKVVQTTAFPPSQVVSPGLICISEERRRAGREVVESGRCDVKMSPSFFCVCRCFAGSDVIPLNDVPSAKILPSDDGGISRIRGYSSGGKAESAWFGGFRVASACL